MKFSPTKKSAHAALLACPPPPTTTTSSSTMTNLPENTDSNRNRRRPRRGGNEFPAVSNSLLQLLLLLLSRLFLMARHAAADALAAAIRTDSNVETGEGGGGGGDTEGPSYYKGAAKVAYATKSELAGYTEDDGGAYYVSGAKYAESTDFLEYDEANEEDYVVGLAEDELPDDDVEEPDGGGGDVVEDGSEGGGDDGRSLRVRLRRGTITAKAWLAEHNKRRRKYHPKFGLQKWVPMTWSPSLARDAQAYAEELARSCRFEHDYSTQVGENLIGGDYLLKSADVALRLWVEDEEFDYDNHGHFTQVLWRSTHYVGCGSASRASGQCARLVCRYLRPGNCNMRPSIAWQHRVMMQPNTPCGPKCPREGCRKPVGGSRTSSNPKCTRKIGARCASHAGCCGRTRKCNPKTRKCMPCRKAKQRCTNDSVCCGRQKCRRRGRFKRCGN